MNFIFFGWGIAAIAFVVAIVFFKAKFVWWEYAILAVLPPFMAWGIYAIDVEHRTNDVEFFTNQVVKVEYYEYWETYVRKTCTRSYNCNCRTVTRGSGKTRTSHRECSTCYETYDCSYCDHNAARYIAYNERGQSADISAAEFNRIANKFGTKRFVELNRSINHSGGCGQDGDLYVAEWDGNMNKFEPYCTDHVYENKIRLNNSYGFRDLTKTERARVFDYPAINNVYQPSVVGNWYNNEDLNWSRFLLDRFNGQYGKSKQIKAFIFTYYNQTDDVANLQRIFFQNGNKNEIILCVGYDCCGATWVKAFSWTDEKVCENEAVRFYSRDMKLYQLVEHMIPVWTANWKRKEFTPFNEIMEISPSNTAWWIMIIIIVLTVTAMVFFFSRNEFNPK